jgi:hypothetical protein
MVYYITGEQNEAEFTSYWLFDQGWHGIHAFHCKGEINVYDLLEQCHLQYLQTDRFDAVSDRNWF